MKQNRLIESFENFVENRIENSETSNILPMSDGDDELKHLERALELAGERLSNAHKKGDSADIRLAMRDVDRKLNAIQTYHNKQNKNKYRVNDIIIILKKNGIKKGENYRMGSSLGYYMNDKYSPTIILLNGIKSDIFKKVVDDLISDGLNIK